MGLDARGDISIMLVILYIPVFCVSLWMTFRLGLSHQAGWIFLFTFSVVRILGGALHIAAELVKPANISMYIGAFVLETAGVAPLLLSTSCLLQVIGEGEKIAPKLAYYLSRMVISVGFVLAVIGASKSTGSSTRSATTLRRAAAVVLSVSLLIIILVDAVYWRNAWKIRRLQVGKYMLLVGVTLALPFLVVRVAYTCLSSFSAPVSLTTVPVSGDSAPMSGSASSLAKFNSITGEWWIFLVMSLLMEIIVVAIYLLFAMRLPVPTKTKKNSPAVDDREPKQLRGVAGDYDSREMLDEYCSPQTVRADGS